MARTDSLGESLQNKRSGLVKKWLGVLLDTYSDQAAEFMRSKTNRFDNPVGTTLRSSLEKLFDLLVTGFDPDQAAGVLDGIVRIRAIQDFPASDSLAFIFQLKDLLRSELGPLATQDQWAEDFQRLLLDIDRMALLAFDLYVACRNQLADIRIKEVERQNHMAWRRAGMLEEAAENNKLETGDAI